MFSSGFVESSIATFTSRSPASGDDEDEYEDSEDDWDEDDASDFDEDEATSADDPLVIVPRSAFDSARRAPSSSAAGSQPSSAAVSDDGEAEEEDEEAGENEGGERTPDQQPSRRAQSDRGGDSGSFVDAPVAPPLPTKGRKSSRNSTGAKARTNGNPADNRPRFEVIVTDASCVLLLLPGSPKLTHRRAGTDLSKASSTSSTPTPSPSPLSPRPSTSPAKPLTRAALPFPSPPAAPTSSPTSRS